MKQGLGVAMVAVTMGLAACSGRTETPEAKPMTPQRTKYVDVALTSDLFAKLTDKERAMVPLLIDACREMDAIFWLEGYGDKTALLASIADPELRRFAEINYGPWDRLNANAPFIPGVSDKPKGAGYYPADMTSEQLYASALTAPSFKSPYTIVRRDAKRRLVALPFHEAFAEQVQRAAGKLREAAAFAEDSGLRTYL